MGRIEHALDRFLDIFPVILVNKGQESFTDQLRFRFSECFAIGRAYKQQTEFRIDLDNKIILIFNQQAVSGFAFLQGLFNTLPLDNFK